jgi:aminoglycoside/choline kinase family phosphotransferase
MNTYNDAIKEAYRKIEGKYPEFINPLPPSGSNRIYFRIGVADHTVIAAYNPDRTENEAFVYITKKLHNAGVSVPTLYILDLDHNIYLLEDLGDVDLFKIVSEAHHTGTDSYKNWYKEVIKAMPSIQHKASKDFDFSICYPRSAFDKQSMLWDLNYFKYHFLKLAYTPFHEQKLEDDFHSLVEYLAEAPYDFFLFRDFQSRNIMIRDNKVYFIDYQGGRKGALQYDLASLLFEAKTALTSEFRSEMLKYYLDVYNEYSFFDKRIFLKYFPGFVLIRLLQAFGAYGYRGYFERKPYFLQSIPPAMASLKWLLFNLDLGVKLPHLRATLLQMIEQPAFQVAIPPNDKLTVSIFSFSYRRGLPEDYTGNGGGYVFDCRLLPNPGVLDQFKGLTGKDEAVIHFLADKPEVGQFLENVTKIVFASVNDYISKGYQHLMISFGCTGGQHRSVYCAEHISAAIRKNYDIHVNLVHREQKTLSNRNAMHNQLS